jgi:hypothetical protein
MSAVRDLTQSAPTEVTFQVERVGWPSPDRIEVVGRWFGVRGRRFIRPTLYVSVDGKARRLLAVLDHKPWAVEDGESWIAAFQWEGEPVELSGAELTVGPDITVELGGSGERHSTGRRFTRRPRADELEGELAAMRDKARQLGRELHAARAEHSAERSRIAAEHEAELEKLRAERARTGEEAEHQVAELRGELDAQRDRVARLETAVRKARQELAVARSDAAVQREGIADERAAIEAELSKSVAKEVEALRAERDTARRESATARGERDAAIRDRDRARQERQVLLSRVRSEGEKRRGDQPVVPARQATAALPAPPVVTPASTTPQAPGGRDLAARVAAIAAILLLVAVVALLLL